MSSAKSEVFPTGRAFANDAIGPELEVALRGI